MIARAVILSGGLSGALAAMTPAGAAEVFAGAFIHDVDLGLTACCSEDGANIQFGIRSGPLGRFLGGELRAYALGSVSAGDGVAFGAIGLAVRYDLTDALYLQPGLGAAVHDGPGEKYQATNDRLYFGSRVLFQPELSLGWRLNDRLAAELSWVHLSHAQLAGKQNPGTDDIGLRLVWRFGP